MGNCVCINKATIEDQVDQLYSTCSPGNKIRLLISKEGKIVFLADPSTAVDPISQKAGEENDCSVRKVKLVVSKKQLTEMLFKNGVEEFESTNEFAFQVMKRCQDRERWWKWQPALATIPE